MERLTVYQDVEGSNPSTVAMEIYQSISSLKLKDDRGSVSVSNGKDNRCHEARKSKLLVQCVGTAAVERTHAEEPRGTTTKAAVVKWS